MSKKSNLVVIILAVVIALVGAYIYFSYRTPSGVTPLSDNSETVAWIGLAAALIGLLTALVGLVSKIIERRSEK